jgi:putative membrane protein
MSTLFAFLHHLCAFTLVAAIAVEFILLGQVQTNMAQTGAPTSGVPGASSGGESGLTHAIAKRLVKADAVLGAAAGLLLVVGLCRVFFFEKGESYYMISHAFLAKFSIFIVVGLLSIMPTMEFLSWRPAIAAGRAPKADPKKLAFIKKFIHGELAAIVIILLCAAIMARGGWV